MSVAAVTLVALLLRLPSYGDSLFGDELSTYFIVSGHSVGHVVYLLQGHSVDLNPPLFFVLAWIAERFGESAQALRLVSLLAGTAAIPLTYLLGLRTVGRRAALIGAVLMALSPMLIFYSTEARAYALSLFLVLACTFCLLRSIDTRRFRWWAAYAACSCAAIYTHYITVFFLGTLFLWAFLTQPDARRPLLAANLAAAIAYIPWLPTLLKDTRSPGNLVISYLEPFSFHLVRSYLARWSFGHPLLPLATLPGQPAIAILVLALVAGLLGVALRALPAGGGRALPRPSAGISLVLVLALAPPVAIALYSSVGHSVWEVRNLIAGWPALALTVGALVSGARTPFRVAAVALVIVSYAIGAAKMLDPNYQRPGYDPAVSFIDRVGTSADPVVDLPAPTPGPLTELDAAFALGGQSSHRGHVVLRLGYPTLSALLRSRPYAPVAPVPLPTVIKRATDLARRRTLFVVSVFRSAALLGPLDKLLPARFRLVETRTFAGLLPVFVYVFRDS